MVLTQIFPAMLAFSVVLLVIASGLSNGRPWARPLTAAFWVILMAVLAWVGGRSQLANTLATTLPVASVILGYLYFNPSVQSYFATRARRDAVAAALAAGLLSVQALQAQTAVSDSAAIHQLNRQFSAAYVRGDPAAMAELYTSDAVLFPEKSAAISGREAIRRYWTLAPGRRITRHVIIPSQVTVDGRHAYEHGRFEIAGEGDGTAWGPFQGKYVVVWRREGARWRIHLDMWNSGPQPPS